MLLSLSVGNKERHESFFFLTHFRCRCLEYRVNKQVQAIHAYKRELFAELVPVYYVSFPDFTAREQERQAQYFVIISIYTMSLVQFLLRKYKHFFNMQKGNVY